MAKLEIRKRDKVIRKRKSFVVIGCEGRNKTEKTYFSNFSSRNCILKFSTGNSTDPVGMAEDLINYIKKEDFSVEYGDKIYLILDTDIGQDKTSMLKQAEKMCNENGIILITSTPTFELWYLLHDSYTTKMYNSSIEVKRVVKSKIDGYTESMNVYPIICDRTVDAIENAKRLESYQLNNSIELISENANPYTSVYKVVEELMKRNDNTFL